jgi:hypothetical protein
MKRFFNELKRRNVYKVAVAYAVVGWLLIQIATQVFPFFEIPNWAVRLVVLLLIIGFPVAVISLRGDPRFEKIVASLVTPEARLPGANGTLLQGSRASPSGRAVANP